MFSINPELKSDLLKAQFDDNGRIRVMNFLSELQANFLYEQAQQAHFNNAFFIHQHNHEASDEQIAQLNHEQRRQLYRDIYQHAARGVGFLYGRHKIESTQKSLFADFLKFMNSEQVLSFIKQISGIDKLSYADGQLTRYRVGDYLTRHKDDPAGETRKLAYVLSLSPMWHPDWGGLLQFYQKNGDPELAYAPKFNTLTLFDVTQIHTVTTIAPFAPTARYSITGWFRT